MKVSKTPLSDVLLIETDLLRDSRGHFAESWNAIRYEGVGISGKFVQDNFSVSRRGVLRGLHFQCPHPQDKLVQVLQGAVFDAIVDLRKGSPTFGKWWGTELTEENGRQLFVPIGFAHGFQAVREDSVLVYICSEFYHPESERTILWNDSDLGISWPIENPIFSPKDSLGLSLSEWLKRPESAAFGFEHP